MEEIEILDFELESIEDSILDTPIVNIKRDKIDKLMSKLSKVKNLEEHLLKKKHYSTLITKLAAKWDYVKQFDFIREIVYSNPKVFFYAALDSSEAVLYNAPDNVYNFSLNGKPILESFFEEGSVNKKTFHAFAKFPNIFNYILRYDTSLLYRVDLNDLLLEEKNGRLLLDELLDIKQYIMLGEIYSEKLIKEIVDRKAYHLLVSVSEHALLYKIDGKSVMEIMLENDIHQIKTRFFSLKYKEKMVSLFKKSEDEINDIYIKCINILVNKNDIGELANIDDEEFLLIDTIDGQKLIDVLYAKTKELKYTLNINNPHLAKYIIEKEYYELYTCIDEHLLVSNVDLNQTYLDLILEQKKKNNKIEVSMHRTPTKQKAKLVIIFAKHGFKKDLMLTVSDLIQYNSVRKKTLLDFLLEEDRESTLEYVISKEAQEHPTIKTAIRMFDFKQKIKSIGNIGEKLIEEKLERYRQEKLPKEEEDLLSELYNVMNDGKSDLELLEFLILNYRHLFRVKNPYAYEVINIINIKRKDPSFSIIKSNDGCSYSNLTNQIKMDLKTEEAINHELGHAFFSNLTDMTVPQEFEELLKKLQYNEDILKNTYEHSLEYQRALKEAHNLAETIVKKEYSKVITKKEMKEYQEMLKKSNLDPAIIKKILATSQATTISEYVQKDIEIRIKEIESLILRDVYADIVNVSDILDAIHHGAYMESILAYNGIPIKGNYGHGLFYYTRGTQIILNEMIANYSRILKTNSKTGIDALRKYVGDELVDFLDKYYNENILSKINENIEVKR